MKKSKLLVLSLLAVSAMSLTSCGEAGPKGDKGDQGAQGEKGDTGTPGKDGTNGVDGKSFLNGEGVPSDTLGNDGDSYVDTKTFDYYAKENGKWVLKGNIKGEKGDQGDQGEKGDTGAKGDAGAKGDKGDTGSTGSKGDKGDQGATAWSNTILYTDGVNIVPDKGSYIAEKDTVVFTITVDANEATGEAFSLIVNGKKEDVTPVTGTSNKFKYETTMKAGGFVVQANFESFETAFTSGTVNLVKDYSLTKSYDVTSVVNLNLNGHKITAGANKFNVYTGGDLKVNTNGVDGLIEGTGVIVDVDDSDGNAQVANESLFGSEISAFNNELRTFDDSSTAAPKLEIGAKVKIKSTSGTEAAIKQVGTESTVNIMDGSTIEGNAKAIEVSGGASTIIAGTVSGTTKAIEVSGGKDVQISGSVTGGSTSAVEVSGGKVSLSGTVSASKSGSTNVVKVTAAAADVTISGSVSGKDNVVEVSNGSVKIEGSDASITASEGTAIKTSGDGSLIVSNGAVSGATNAVTVNGGSVTIDGGTISVAENAISGASTAVIKIEDGVSEGTKVELNGGTINNANSNGSTISGANSNNVEVDIKDEVKVEKAGSEVTGIKVSDYIETNVSSGEDSGTISTTKTTAVVVGENIVYTLKAMEGYVLSSLKIGDDEYLAKVVDSKIAVALPSSKTTITVSFEKVEDISSKFVFESGGIKKVYDSLKAAIDAGESDIKLLQEITINDSQNTEFTLDNKKVKIDLNGKTLSFKNNNRLIVSNGSEVEFVDTASTKGKLYAEENGNDRAFIKVQNTSNNSLNKVKINEGVKVEVINKGNDSKSVYALAVFNGTNSKKTKSEVTINGTITVDKGSGVCVLGDITTEKGYLSSDNKVTFGEKTSIICGAGTKAEGAKIYEAAAIYQAGLSEVTINGGTYEGHNTAVEVRAGKLTINNGTFTSKAESFSTTKNDGGPTTIGAALAVVQHKPQESIAVTVSNGTFNGYYSVYAADVEENGTEAIKKVQVTLNGGTYNSKIVIKDGITYSGSYSYTNTTDFAGGLGTEESPYIISSISEWNKLGSLNNYGKGLYFKLSNDLDFTDTKSTINRFDGTLDLGGKTITLPKGWHNLITYLYGVIKNGTILPYSNDIDFKTNDVSIGIVYSANGNAQFIDLTIGTENGDYKTYDACNDGFLCNFVGKDDTSGSNVTFKNVTNYVDYFVRVKYELSYGSAFLSGYCLNNTGKVTFDNCVNHGDIELANASVFVGNSAYYVSGMYTFKDCKYTGNMMGFKEVDLYVWGKDTSGLTGITNNGTINGPVTVKDTIDSDNLVEDATSYLLNLYTYVTVYDSDNNKTGTRLVRCSKEIVLKDLSTLVDTSKNTYSLKTDGESDLIELKDGVWSIEFNKDFNGGFVSKGSRFEVSGITYAVYARDTNNKLIAISKQKTIAVTLKDN